MPYQLVLLSITNVCLIFSVIASSKQYTNFFYSTGNDKPDEITWKLQILKLLQQAGGVFGQAIEFDILSNKTISGRETIVRVVFEDHVKFTEYISMGVFDEDKNPGCVRIVSKSASLQGVVTDIIDWNE